MEEEKERIKDGRPAIRAWRQRSQAKPWEVSEGVSAVSPFWVLPAATNLFVVLGGCGTKLPFASTISVAHSALGVGFPDSVLRSGMKPPPNAATRVKVWVSPARLTRTSGSPLFMRCEVPTTSRGGFAAATREGAEALIVLLDAS
jgi:hypothetical protein